MKSVDEIYNHFKKGNQVSQKYDEEKHCKLLIQVMLDPYKGTVAAFCVEALVTDRTFQNWVNKHELFADIYQYSKMLARKQWDEDGIKLRDADFPMGTVNYSFEHWKMMGWSRFGISKNSKVKIDIDPNSKPNELYTAILRQAREGDFTAAEFKQLMESVNIGLNVHQTYELQKQIDELKSAQDIMEQNSNVKNNFSDKGSS